MILPRRALFSDLDLLNSSVDGFTPAVEALDNGRAVEWRLVGARECRLASSVSIYSSLLHQ